MTHNQTPSNTQVIVIFDLDHTITRKDTYLGFLYWVLRQHPLRLFRASWLPIAVLNYKFGLRNNSWLKKVFLGSIAGGLNKTEIEHCKQAFLKQLFKNGFYKDATEAIEQHREAGHQLILATASFDFYVIDLATQLGFEHVICTQSVWDQHDHLQADINGQNCYGEHKLERVVDLVKSLPDSESSLTMAYSDHHSDLPLLLWVDQATAVNPTSKLLTVAELNKFRVVDWK